MGGSNARWGIVAVLLWVGTGCNVFDSARLSPRSDAGSEPQDAGSDGGGDGGDDDGGGMCVPRDEACNDVDDDCDGRDDEDDEDAKTACEAIIVNADTACVAASSGGARCVLLDCLPGWANCDGRPSNGCEAPACECEPCPDDAGTEDDAGAPQ